MNSSRKNRKKWKPLTQKVIPKIARAGTLEKDRELMWIGGVLGEVCVRYNQAQQKILKQILYWLILTTIVVL